MSEPVRDPAGNIIDVHALNEHWLTDMILDYGNSNVFILVYITWTILLFSFVSLKVWYLYWLLPLFIIWKISRWFVRK